MCRAADTPRVEPPTRAGISIIVPMPSPLPSPVRASPDVVVIGGGVMGLSVAAHLAENGRRVVLLERDELGAGASVWNSGIVQHPLDPVLEPLHLATVELYRRLDDETGHALGMPDAPAGLLSVTHDPAVARAEAAALALDFGHLAPTFLDPDKSARPWNRVRAWRGCVPAGHRLPGPAHRCHARICGSGRGARRGESAKGSRRPPGSRHHGHSERASRTAHPSRQPMSSLRPDRASPALVDPSRRWRPILPLWGVVVTVDLASPPRHVAEEAASTIGATHDPWGADDGSSGVMFSLVTVAGACSRIRVPRARAGPRGTQRCHRGARRSLRAHRSDRFTGGRAGLRAPAQPRRQATRRTHRLV